MKFAEAYSITISKQQAGPLSSLKWLFNDESILSTSTAYDGITIMLNSDSNEQRDQLTREWRDHKVEELNFVGTVVGARLIPFFSRPVRGLP